MISFTELQVSEKIIQLQIYLLPEQGKSLQVILLPVDDNIPVHRLVFIYLFFLLINLNPANPGSFGSLVLLHRKLHIIMY